MGLHLGIYRPENLGQLDISEFIGAFGGPGFEVTKYFGVKGFVNSFRFEQVGKDGLPLVHDYVVGPLRTGPYVGEWPSTRLCGELSSVANMLPSLIAIPIAYSTGVSNLAFTVLTEFLWRTQSTVTRSLPVQALMYLALMLTGDTTLATVALTVQLELVGDTATLTFRADKEFATLRVVCWHSRINRDEHGVIIPLPPLSLIRDILTFCS